MREGEVSAREEESISSSVADSPTRPNSIKWEESVSLVYDAKKINVLVQKNCDVSLIDERENDKSAKAIGQSISTEIVCRVNSKRRTRCIRDGKSKRTDMEGNNLKAMISSDSRLDKHILNIKQIACNAKRMFVGRTPYSDALRCKSRRIRKNATYTRCVTVLIVLYHGIM